MAIVRNSYLRAAAFSLALLLALFVLNTQTTQGAHLDPVIDATIDVGGGPFAIALDPATGLLYTSSPSTDTVSVIDTGTDTVVATISPGIAGPFSGVGVLSSLGYVYVSDFSGGEVEVIATSTNAVVDTVGVGSAPVGVGVNTATGLVYVANLGSGTVSVIDSATNSVVATVAVGSSPVGVAVNSLTNRVYVTNNSGDSVSVIDGSTNTLEDTLVVGDGPFGVGVNDDAKKVYVANFSSATVSVIDGDPASPTFHVEIAAPAVAAGPVGVGVNPVTGFVYVASQSGGSVVVIDGATNSVAATIAGGPLPTGVAVNSAIDRAYVANLDAGFGTVSVIANLSEDSDGDGILDDVDNCVSAPNADQLDTDGDGAGDVCDTDDDNDGFDDAVDGCPLVSGTAAGCPDADGDGIPDATDIDDDNDGIADSVDGRFIDDAFVDESLVASIFFTDQHLGGTSSGSVVDDGGLDVSVDEAPNPLGLDIVAAGGGAGEATIGACDTPILLTDGDSIFATCSSLTLDVITGPVEALITEDMVLTVPGATTVGVTGVGGTPSIQNLGAQTISFMVNETEIVLGPGDTYTPILTAPEATVNVTLFNGGETLSEPHSVQISKGGEFTSGDTVVLRPNRNVSYRLVSGNIKGPWQKARFGPGTTDWTLEFATVAVSLFNGPEALTDPHVVEISKVGVFTSGDVFHIPPGKKISYRLISGKIKGPWQKTTFEPGDIDWRLEFATITVVLFNGLDELFDPHAVEVSKVGIFNSGDVFHLPPGKKVSYRLISGGIKGPWQKTTFEPGETNWGLEFATIAVTLFNGPDTLGDPHKVEISKVGVFSSGDVVHLPPGKKVSYRLISGEIKGPWQKTTFEAGDLDWRLEFSTIAVTLYNGDEVLGDPHKVEISKVGVFSSGDVVHLPPGKKVSYRLISGEIKGRWQKTTFEAGDLDWRLEFATIIIRLDDDDGEELVEGVAVEISKVGVFVSGDVVHLPPGEKVSYRLIEEDSRGKWHKKSFEAGDTVWTLEFDD